MEPGGVCPQSSVLGSSASSNICTKEAIIKKGVNQDKKGSFSSCDFNLEGCNVTSNFHGNYTRLFVSVMCLFVNMQIFFRSRGREKRETLVARLV